MMQILFMRKCWRVFRKHSHFIINLLQWPTLLLFQLIDAAPVINEERFVFRLMQERERALTYD